MTENLTLCRCSDCGSAKLLETYFSKNVKGLYNKTCDGCRTKRKGRKRTVSEKSKETIKLYYENNKDRLAVAHKKWLLANREKVKKSHQDYRTSGKNNCEHGIRKDTCRICSPNSYLKKIVSKRIWAALQTDKSKNSLEYLGCDIPTFRQHLEKSFKENMTWENQGKDGWDIDHIIPVLYKQDDIEPSLEEVGKRLHYTNCQAMWHIENMKKGNSYCGDYQDSDSD